MKKTCDNCYNNFRPTLDRIVPMDECLEHNPDFGVDTSSFWEGNGTHDGIQCPHWHERMKLSINGKPFRRV